jgi:RNA polymerase sigma-70 factor (ECF subfamily)
MDWKPFEPLFGAYLAGDAAAARELFSAISKALRGYYRVRVGGAGRGPEDAEDLVQACLLKIHFARDRYDSSQSLKTWVFTIASRTLIDHWRGRSSEEELLEAPGETSEEVPDEVLSPEEKTLLHRDLNQALATLKPIDRSIVYLYGVEGLSMAEIAATHSLTESAAKLRAHRAYKELRKVLN